MTHKQLAAYEILLVGCGSPTSGAVNGLSQRWAKGCLIHHWLFLSLFSLALMCLFPLLAPLPSLALSFCCYPLSKSISVTLLSPFSLHSWLPVFLSLSLFVFSHPLPRFSPYIFFPQLPSTLFPSYPSEQATGHILVGLIGYDKGDKRLWDGITLPGPLGFG